MIEKTILDYLNDTLTVPAYMEKPEDPPARYVLIEKTGSGESDHLHSAVIALQSYAGSLIGAAQLNEEVKAAMAGILVLDRITRAKLNSDYNFTDDTKKQYRYQAVYNITHY